MKAYLDILRNVRNNGVEKQPVRFDADGNPVPVENGTIGTFCEIFRHDMSQGFPLITTKFVSLKTIAIELEGFIKGVTDKQWFKQRKCNIWNSWANPKLVNDICERNPEADKKEVQYNENDLGPIYGYQWRAFDHQYQELDYIEVGEPNAAGEQQLLELNRDGVDVSCDQLKSIVDKLKTNPYDRRMVCSAWNPNQIHLMALPPCHYGFTVVVYGNKLNLCWKQRSCDLLLGVPFNIASYALLLKLLAREANLEEGELVGVLEDAHIYTNHLSQVDEQLNRKRFPLPRVKITGDKDIFNWTYQDFELIGYISHGKIKAEVTV